MVPVAGIALWQGGFSSGRVKERILVVVTTIIPKSLQYTLIGVAEED